MHARSSSPRSRILGNVAWVAGLLALGTVLCFRFPALLTTPEARSLYPLELVRAALTMIIAVGCFAGVWACARGRRRGLAGACMVIAALALGGAMVPVGAVRGPTGMLSLDWLLADLLLLAAIFIPLERIHPLRPRRNEGRRTDAIYFVVNHLGLHAFTLVAAGMTAALAVHAIDSDAVDAMQRFVGDAPLWVQVPVILLVADLVEYGVHRALHEIPWLWRIHAIHHSSEQMDALAGSRVHVAETLMMRSSVYLCVHLLGFSFAALLLYGAIITLQATLIHANVKLSYGIFDRILVSPRVHHVHHASDDEAIDKNYAGTFAFIDLLFGTFYLPHSGRWPARYGVVKERIPRTFVGQLLFPMAPEQPVERRAPVEISH